MTTEARARRMMSKLFCRLTPVLLEAGVPSGLASSFVSTLAGVGIESQGHLGCCAQTAQPRIDGFVIVGEEGRGREGRTFPRTRVPRVVVAYEVPVFPERRSFSSRTV